MYSCGAHCSSLGLQCVEKSAYDCLDAAKQVTHRKNTDELYAIKTDCSTGAGCFVDRFSLVRVYLIIHSWRDDYFMSRCPHSLVVSPVSPCQLYSELVTHVNASVDTCHEVPTCTDINGGSLQQLHLVCGCRPLPPEEEAQFGLRVQLTPAQLVGIAALLLCSAVLLIILLKKCCSASLFLRYVVRVL